MNEKTLTGSIRRGRGIALFLVGLLLCCSAGLSYAAPASAFKTGQTTSYATNDDGSLKKGVAWPAPRFTDNNNGTITDNLTGLIWLKNADCYGAQSWASALTLSNGLASGSCGLTDGSKAGDWRLPNREELASLIDFGYYGPAISNTAGTGQWMQGDPFNNVQSDWYWSSTTYAGNSVSAWVVYMVDGDVGNLNKSDYDDNDFLYVWPVRGGQAGSLGTLVLSVSKTGTGSGTVTSDPAGIDCGVACSGLYNAGTVVTLTPSPDTGSTFAGWSGDCDSSGQVTMDLNKTCTATFDLIQRTLTVTKTGTGAGTVTGGANCTLNWSGGTGACTVDDGTAITLSAAAGTGSIFEGWSNGTGAAASCSGTGDCTFNITADSGVTAPFTGTGGTGPDLTGSWMKLDGYLAGRWCYGKIMIENIGNRNAGKFTVAYYLSDDGTTLGQLLQAKTVRGLNVREEKALSFWYHSTTSLSGKYVIAVIDSEDQVAETDENNNRTVDRVSVP